MGELQIPEKIKCKVIVDTIQGRYGAHPGLLLEDHIRIAQDLKKIARMPLASDCYENNPDNPIMLGLNKDKHLPSAILPYRKVEVQCNTEDGRIKGYSIKDRIATIYASGGKSLTESIEGWYENSTTEWASGTYPKFVGNRLLTLEQLDKQ